MKPEVPGATLRAGRGPGGRSRGVSGGHCSLSSPCVPASVPGRRRTGALRPGEGPTGGGGDYLWRTDDHDQARRDIGRHSARDAAVYDEYDEVMAEMARFVKPVLGMVPIDPFAPDLRSARELYGIFRRFRAMPPRLGAFVRWHGPR